MQMTIDPPIELIAMCPAMALWLAPPSQLSDEGTVPGHRAQPFSPSVGIIDLIPPADFKRKTARTEGRAFSFLLQPVDVAAERIVLSEFAPKEHISTVVSFGKAGKACGPRAEGPVAILFAYQAGVTGASRRPPGGKLAAPPPFAVEPRIETKAWSAASLKPSEPLAHPAACIPFEPQTAGPGEIRRPKQALRELVQPSARPWHSLSILWQSFRGFHLALPAVEVASDPDVQARGTVLLWNSPSDEFLSGRRFLRESAEIPFEREPSDDGARARLTGVQPISIVELFSTGFTAAIRGGKASVEDPDPFTKMVSERLPLPKSVETPAPIIALSHGLSVWNGTINSYIRRTIWAPRLREGGRAIHTLRLAPVIQVNEPSEITPA